MSYFYHLLFLFSVSCLLCCQSSPETPEEQSAFHLEIDQLTEGPGHHFFGYIGHVQNIPWNGSGNYLLTFKVEFIDRMPTADDVAEILLLDAQNNYEARKIAETRAWNPQQGSMMYWNPDRPDTQFFFNDRDPETNQIFCVLFDIEENRRIKEYRFDDTPVGNGGIRQNGGLFAGINYGRMARLRLVTGYPEAYDWNTEDLHPADDGVFVVDIESGEKRLLVSFQQMRDVLVEEFPRIDTIPLFINHTLWNREGDRLFFFCRGHFGRKQSRINVPMTIQVDGSGLTKQNVFIGGHPEWEFGPNMIGVLPKEEADGSSEREGQLVLYDSEKQAVIREIGTHDIFPDPGNDVALSPDGKWLVQGIEEGSRTAYSIFRRSDMHFAHTPWFDQKQYDSGKLRIDAAPKWNRESNQVLFSSLTEEEESTRQLFLIRVVKNE